MIQIDFTAFDFAPLALMAQTLAAVIGLSFVLAVAAAWKAHDFKWSRLDEFVTADLLPALVILATEMIGILTTSATLQVAAIGGAAAFSAVRMEGLIKNFKALIGWGA